jgi:kynurenine formamidase
MNVLLSYPFAETTPFPNGGLPVRITAHTRIARGANSDTSVVSFWNHSGTHVDGPAHMVKGATPLCSFGIDRFIFERPVLVDVPKRDSELVMPADLKAAGCDLLLLRTGFGRYRDKERYRTKSPGLSAAVAEFIVENFPSLKALGIDSISMAAPDHLDEGIEAHKILFRNRGRDPILLIEDLDLRSLANPIKKVYALPLLVEGLDSAPCTVVAEL